MKDMKSPIDKPGSAPIFGGGLEEFDKLLGRPGVAGKSDSLVDRVAHKLDSRESSKTTNSPETESGPLWRIHKRFADLHHRLGKPFSRFVGDLLDIILTGPVQDKILGDLPADRADSGRSSRDSASSSDSGATVPGPDAPQTLIGDEPRRKPRNFLKRKANLAALVLDRGEYPAFVRLMKQVRTICDEEKDSGFTVPPDPQGRKKALEEIIGKLSVEITSRFVAHAWLVLESEEFASMEWLHEQVSSAGLLRPSYYEDLDRAYRETKKLLKLLLVEFEGTAPITPQKRDGIASYLQDILEVYTHHHFVLKHYHRTRPSVSREEFETTRRELNSRVEALKSDNQDLRREAKKTEVERDQAIAEARTLRNELEDLRGKVQKLDPAEVARQIKALEAKMNLIQKEHQETLEEDAELRSALRQMDAENQRLTKQLRDLHALPDEDAKSVAGLLAGKHVAIFGGVGRDHYINLLREAGVKEEDYEWYEGYHTISQARTADIVGRSDLIVVITSYAGHLLLWQTRSAMTPQKTLFLIHNSGAGSLRQQIIEKFRKSGA